MQSQTIEGFRLSPQQLRLWSLQQATANDPYRVQAAIKIAGNLDQQILARSLQQLVDRHEILRTSFRCLPGMTVPLQVIHEGSAFSNQKQELGWLSCHDFQSLDAQTQVRRIEQLWYDLSQVSLDLEQAPTLRSTLVTLSDHHLLLLVLPTLCGDRITLNNFVQELAQSYAAQIQEEPLTADPIQYADLAEWQHELLESEEIATGSRYWQQQPKPFDVQLPFEQRLTNLISMRSLAFPLAPLTSRSEQFIQQEACLSDFLLTCWQVLLWRLTKQQEFPVGVAFEGRRHEELKSAFGLFEKHLPIQASLQPQQAFRDVLQQISTLRRAADHHQDYFTWDNWQQNSASFFPFCFEYTDDPIPVNIVGLTFSLSRQWVCSDRFKLKLCCRKQNDSLTVELQYDERIFDVDTVRRFAANLQTLIKSALDTPNTSIGQLDILSSQERQTLLVELNSTPTELASADCIHHLIEAQAARVPDAIAVVCEDQHLTYAQLNGRANQLAHYLQAQGVEPDTPVALYLERSCNLLVGLLGILKAGGAYLPIDPALPTEAIHLRLRDAQVPLVITQQSLVANLLSDTATICLDRDWEATIAQHDAANPASVVTPEHLVYVIYTSGSTGQPKGVAVEHCHLWHYLQGMQQRLHLSDGASYALVSTIAADLGNTQIFSALCSGGCLHLISQERATHPDAFAAYAQQHQIDCLKLVPSHLNALLSAAASPAHILPRQCLVLGGEAAHWTVVERVRQLAPTCRILNHYGPTETTVGVLTHEVGAQAASSIVPLGRPLANTQTYLLDDGLQPVALGVAGELYIGGASVARGYFNQPELTAERFIPDPFRSNRRLYKTGDLARYQVDGVIEFLGRLDDQVKLHGYRIELGEIEAVLRHHSDVQDAVVMLREEQSGQLRLVAYVVMSATTTTDEVRTWLSHQLPDYMLPSTIVPLKTLPLTSNGKIDRRALPAPETAQLNRDSAPPRSRAERTLVQIWQQVLGLEQIGIHDNFFALGGDSILSIQVIARANREGLQLTPKQLFEHQTIAQLALVTGTNCAIAAQGIVTGNVPLTPIQQWFFEQQFAESHHWNQAVLLECHEPIQLDRLEQTVEHLRRHHDVLRSRFVQTTSGWQQIIEASEVGNPVIQFDFSDLSVLSQKSAIEAAAADLQASLNLTQGAIARVALFNLGHHQPQRVLLIIHHLVVDGVSWRILLEDFQTIYHQLSVGEPVHLPAKTTSFKQWAEQLQSYAQSTDLQLEQHFWIETLNSSASIPVDHSNGKNTVASAQTISVELTEAETQTLLQRLPQVFNTKINDVLLTAMLQAFHSWIETSSLLIDLETHGREELFADVDLSRTVGWFTAVCPVRLMLETTEPKALLKAVKQQLEQIPDRGIGYGLLRYLNWQRSEEVRSAKSVESLPQPQVKFNYLGQFDQVFQPSGLFQPATESQGATRSLQATRTHLLEVVGLVTAGKLCFDWTYSRNLHNATTIEQLAQKFMVALRCILQSSEGALIHPHQSAQPPSNPDSDLVTRLKADAQLDSSIRPGATLIAPTSHPQQILLTGATGFLGAFLLNELLHQTQADVYCLMRSPDLETARQRLRQHLAAYSVWDERVADRIIPVIGDLAKPLLGLTSEQFNHLASQLDVIYHNGASVNLAYPYSTVRAANVLGTEAILQLATQTKLKPIHYVSTLSVFSGANQNSVMPELNHLQSIQPPAGGYAQSKWVAEKLLWEAGDRGIPVTVYRPGRILGHQQTGICNTRDRLALMLRGCLALGYAPAAETLVDMTPVDYVSQAIVHLSQQSTSRQQAFHICNPHSISWCDLVTQIKALGYPLQLVSYDQWQRLLFTQWQTDLKTSNAEIADHPLHSLMILFAESPNPSVEQSTALAQTINAETRRFDCRNTLVGLSNTTIACPAIDAQLLHRYLTYFTQSGFFTVPQPSY